MSAIIDRDMPDDPHLVPGRACGSCNACCVALTIDDPELQKPQGHRCPNSDRDGGCTIYATRPHTCRTFYCGWRQLKWIRESLRPDQSGVLVLLDSEISKVNATERLAIGGVQFMLLNKAALKAEGLAESVAAAVAAKIPVYLCIPGEPGFTVAGGRINEDLEEAVRIRDKAAVLRILRERRTVFRSVKRERVVLSGHAGWSTEQARE
ncbi:MAG TPA: YkgJ family cysteine cluster protein [Stellaceae bacterium]|nr:YkgJ family cysteine cluster protein [Stellaceae bacterium]